MRATRTGALARYTTETSLRAMLRASLSASTTNESVYRQSQRYSGSEGPGGRIQVRFTLGFGR